MWCLISRRYPKHPLPGVGALIFRRGSILLIERGGNPLKCYWSLPGGLLETGETLVEGVTREVLEETGLRVKVVEFYGIFERIMRDAKGRAEYHYLLHDYVCKVVSGTMKAGDDVSRVEWVPRARLKDYKMTEGTLDVINEAYDSALRKRT
ncbi:MAG: NUDIX hydrolase [Bryobacteraceae bacterium]